MAGQPAGAQSHDDLVYLDEQSFGSDLWFFKRVNLKSII